MHGFMQEIQGALRRKIIQNGRVCQSFMGAWSLWSQESPALSKELKEEAEVEAAVSLRNYTRYRPFT